MKKRTIGVAAIGFTTLLMLTCLWRAFPTRAHEVMRLEATFPTLEQYQVSEFRNQDWCKNIVYSAGQFSDNNRSSTCNLFDGVALPLEDNARTDFDAVVATLAETGVHVTRASITYDAHNHIQSAEFHLACPINPFCNRPHYVYDPHHTTLRENMPGEYWSTAINTDWFFAQEDWN
jgi:hypothetical protein